MQNQTRNLVIVALVAALVAVTCWKQSPGQGEPAKAVGAKWEYKVAYVSLEKAHRDHINQLGEEGWEICAAFSHSHLVSGSGEIEGKVILKRSKAAK
jgi:hypothetical protein